MDLGNIDPIMLFLLMSNQESTSTDSSGMNPMMLILLMSLMNSDTTVDSFFPIGGGSLSEADNPYLDKVLDIGTAILIDSAFGGFDFGGFSF